MAAADTARLIASLELRDKEFQAAIKRSVGGVGMLEKRIDKIGNIAGRGLSNAARNTERAFVGLGAAAVGAIGASVKVAGDFEAQLNTINTIARTNDAGLKTIGDSVRKLARETGTSLDELTQGYYDLLSAGIKTADAQNVLTAANQLAIGGLASTAETVDLLTTAINTYGGDATKAAQYADVFAKAVERGKVTAAELAQSFAQVGPIAAASGISIRELGAAYARLTASGVPAAEAATQVRSAIVALTRRTSDLEKLEKATGKSYLKIAGKKGLVEALNQLRKDAGKAGIPLIDLLGRVEGLNFTLATTGPNFAAYNADLAAMGDASGTAAEQMAERQKGLNFQLARLKALAKDAGITIGTALIPKLIPLFDKMAKFINAHQGDIQKLGDDLAKGLEDAAVWAGKIDWKTLGDGLRIAAASGKVLIDAFLKAPAWLQGFLITGFAANKFTGGAIGSIIGELGKGLIKGVLGMNAGVVNINAGVVNGAGGAGGVAAASGSKIGALGRVFLIGEAIGLVAAVNGVREGVQAQIAQQAGNLGKQNLVYLAQNPTTAQLTNSLAAIDQGINDLQADPLAVALVSGPALDELKQMRLQTVAAIDRAGHVTERDVQSNERQEALAAQASAKQAAAAAALLGATHGLDATARTQLGGVINQVRASGSNVVSATSAVRAAVGAAAVASREAGRTAAAAIRDKKWQFSVTNVNNNNVSIRDYVVKTSQTNKYGAVAS